jgi:peptide-methionine (S)-S-oxide reductase
MKTKSILRSIVMSGFFGMILAAASNVPDPAVDEKLAATKGKAAAIFAGGCFWCTEAVFEEVKGVKSVVSGYSGGTKETAVYQVVGSGRTDHAEAIEITYDPSVITYGQLLKIFFAVAHDPTQKDRQGPDWGRQYRSHIFTATPEQEKIARAYIAQLDAAKAFDKPIATLVSPLTKFYVAEGYHQDYVANNPTYPYVVVNSLPKVAKLKKTFPELLKKAPKS